MSTNIQKNIICGKKIIFGILPHELVKIANIWELLSTILGISVLMKLQKQKNPVPKKGVPTKTVSTKSTSTGFYVSTEFYYW